MIFQHQERDQTHDFKIILQKEAPSGKQSAFSPQDMLSLWEYGKERLGDVQFFKVKENPCQIPAVEENEKA